MSSNNGSEGLDMSEIEKVLARAVMKTMIEEAGDDETSGRPPEIEAHRMLDFYQDLNAPEKFALGDLVTWKRGLKNGKYPKRDYPAVVSKIYPEPITRDDMESGSNHYLEPLDLIILVDTGDEVSEFHVDSRRFRHYEGKIDGDDIS